MPSIFDRSVREGLEQRVRQLRPDTARRWGQMDAATMQAHLIAGAKMALGTLQVRPKKTPLANPVGRWLVIHSPLPWPKGAPTAPELKDPASVNFETEREELLRLMRAMGDRGQSESWPKHPAFGRLSGRDWGVLIWRHTNHHLRQFGV